MATNLIDSKSGKAHYYIISVLILAVLASVAIYLFFFANPFLKNYDEEIDYSTLVETPNFENPLTKSYLTNPGSVLDLEYSGGNVYLVDSSNQRVMVFDSNLVNLKNLGEKYGRAGNLIVSGKSEDGSMFAYPGSLSISGEGSAYVVDRLNHQVKVFDSNFNYFKSIEIPDSFIGAIEIDDSPQVDSSELNFEVLGNGNYVFHALADKKALVTDSSFNIIKEVRLDEGRMVNIKKSASGFYVIDDGLGRILEYDSSGSLINTLELGLVKPTDMCVIGPNLIVGDKGDGTLKVINSGKLLNNVSVGIMPSYLACSSDAIFAYDDFEGALVKVDYSSWRVQTKVPSLTDMSLAKGAPGYVAVNPVNLDIVVVDTQNHLVLIFNSTWGLKKILGSGYGDSPNSFKYPGGVDFSKNGELYLIDRYNRKVKVFDADYNYVRSVPVENCAMDILVLEDGRFIYGDETTNKVYIMSQEGKVLGTIKQSPQEGFLNNRKGDTLKDGEFGSPHGLGYHNGKYWVIDEAFPVDGSKYHVMVTEFDEQFNFLKRHELVVPENFGLSETVGFYNDMVILPSNEENLVWFYDTVKEEVVEKMPLTHEVAFSVIEVVNIPGTDHAILSNQKDGKVFRVDLSSREILEEKRLASYYQTLSL
jgi:DNA-binding beta-propeller fold protein YncE